MSEKPEVIDTAVRINSVTLVETHKRGKRIHHPQIRNVTGIKVELGKPDDKGTSTITGDVTARQFSAKIEGSINIAAGTMTMNVVNERVSSYLKKKRFRVMGYTPEFRITNTNRKGEQ